MADNMYMTTHPPCNQLGLNINDIIDPVPDENNYSENEMSDYQRGGTPSEAKCSATSSMISRNDPDIEQMIKAYVKIIEQPQPKALRFRYMCEGRSAGSIPGVNSTAENKTFPKIKIVNYKGPAVVVVSCVTVDPPYRPHPHNLVGKEGCSKGVCTVTIDNDSMECVFSYLGIQCVKKKDVEQALKLREEIRVDPFGTGFNHRNQPQNIDLNAVRLCFQVFLNNGKGGRFTVPLKAVVSDPIYDKKAATDLNICKLSDCTSCVSGGKEIILLCDKVSKEDIQVRFYEEKDGHIEWEGFGDFQAADVHKQVAISFKTPKYKDIHIEHSVKVCIQLLRPSDKSTSEPRPFHYLPMDPDGFFGKKRRLAEGNDSTKQEYIDMFYLPDHTISRQGVAGLIPMEGQPTGAIPRSMKVATRTTRHSDIKAEPPDYRLSPPLEPREMRPVSIPPQHLVGGLVYQKRPDIEIGVLPQASVQAHLPNPVFFSAHPSPGQGPTIVDAPLHSPQAHFYQMTPALPLDPSHSPYSPENPPSSSVHPPSPVELLARASVEPANLRLMEETCFNPSESPHQETLPALVINSNELSIDNINNLSESFSCSLNLTDSIMPLNSLDKKSASEEARTSLNTPTSAVGENFVPNIPNSSSEVMKSEDVSDSMKFLKGQLETLNELSKRS